VRRTIVRAAFIGVMLTGTAQAANRKGQSSRRVELISMTALPAVESDGVAAPSSENGADAAIPADFAIHDLSRRYVEFRMKGELTGLVEASPVSQASFAAIPTSSSIAVPRWMRANMQTFAAPAFVPGCAPLAYRPSGFLSRGAEGRRAAYYGMMSSIACEHGIPTGLFDAMIIRESRYNPLAVSPKNAFGFAQLMPGTAAGLGIDRFNPYQNMRGGARYLRQQLDRFGRVQLALAAYNAGPGRIRDGVIPQIPETHAYVTDIIAKWAQLAAADGPATSQSILPSPRSPTIGVYHF
jgi:hypothetical protein